MNAEQIIAEIEWLEALFLLPDKRRPQFSEWRTANRRNALIDRLEKLFWLLDKRPLHLSDWTAAIQTQNEMCAYDPWFGLQKREDV
jgi:hypothetical protein